MWKYLGNQQCFRLTSWTLRDRNSHAHGWEHSLGTAFPVSNMMLCSQTESTYTLWVNSSALRELPQKAAHTKLRTADLHCGIFKPESLSQKSSSLFGLNDSGPGDISHKIWKQHGRSPHNFSHSESDCWVPGTTKGWRTGFSRSRVWALTQHSQALL